MLLQWILCCVSLHLIIHSLSLTVHKTFCFICFFSFYCFCSLLWQFNSVNSIFFFICLSQISVTKSTYSILSAYRPNVIIMLKESAPKQGIYFVIPCCTRTHSLWSKSVSVHILFTCLLSSVSRVIFIHSIVHVLYVTLCALAKLT